MKTYDEMAKNVLRRMEEYTAQQQQKRYRLTRLAVPALCLCLLLLVGAGVGHNGVFEPNPVSTAEDAIVPGTKDWFGPGEEESTPGDTQGEQLVVTVEPFVYLSAPKGNETVKLELMQPAQRYDCQLNIRFLSTKGWTKSAIDQKIRECWSKVQAYAAEYASSNDGAQAEANVGTEGEYIVIKSARNFFQLKLDDIHDVRTIHVTNTSAFGQVEVHGVDNYVDERGHRSLRGKDVTLKQEHISERVTFSWDFFRLYDYLQEHPAPNYADFNDTFHFTVEYTDGRKETADMHIRFSESGEASVTCDGYLLLQ